MPSRGSTEADAEYEETLDQIHEIVIKFNASHDIVIGGDWNGSLHRTKYCAHDSLLRSFLKEHSLILPVNYPVRDTFFHASSDCSSQIDYFVVSRLSKLEEVASIEDMHYLNVSDHTHIMLSLSQILLLKIPKY